MDYCSVLIAARKRRKLTQESLAELAHLGKRGQKYVSTIEKGELKVPGSDKWLPICAALGIDPATGEDLPSGSACAVRAVPDGEWAPLTVEAVRRMEEGFYELRDASGAVAPVKLAWKAGCPSIVFLVSAPALSETVPVYRVGEKKGRRKK